MAFTLSPWIENTLILAPFAYALGFLIAQDTVAYGIAGLLGAGFSLFFGYHILQQRSMLIFAIYLCALSIIGSVAGYIHHRRAMALMEATGIDPISIDARPQSTPNMMITGIVHDAGDPDEAIAEATIRVVNTEITATTDSEGAYTLEIPDVAIFIKKNCYIEADHNGYYTRYSKAIAIKAGTVTTLDFPIEHLVSPSSAISRIRISLTDDHGKSVPAEFKPGDRFGCKIIAEKPLTIDRALGKEVDHEHLDSIELIDQETGQTLFMLDEESLPTQGRISYIDAQTIVVTGSIPGHYLDGAGNTPKTAISPHKDLHVKLIAHINVT